MALVESWHDGVEREQNVERHRPGQQQTVNAIEDTAMPSEKRPGVFHANVALDHRFEEITDCGSGDNREAEDNGFPVVQIALLVVIHPGRENTGDCPAEETLPSLAR